MSSVALVLRRHDEGHTPTTVHWKYEVKRGDTGEIIGVFKDPEFEAARVLLAQGITGTMTTRWRGSDHIAMTLDIETAAKLRTRWQVLGTGVCKVLPDTGP